MNNKMRLRPTIIITAAGSGSRFGGAVHKLDQEFQGSTVLLTTVRQAVRSQLAVVVVTTAARAAALGGVLATRDIVVLSNADAARGMGATIATGVAERSGASGWLVLPGDMPFVRPDSILRVAQGLQDHPVAYARHAGRRGHPVGFRAALVDELLALTGDEGARAIVSTQPSAAIDLEDAGVLQDIDTLADLAAAQRRTAAG